MVWLIDEHANLLFVSPNIDKILGYCEEELLNKNSFELIHPDDVAIANEKLAELYSTKEIDSLIIRCKKASGEWRWIELVATNLLDDPLVNGIVVNSRDITERKLEQEQMTITNTRFQTVLNVTRDVIWEWDLVSGKVYKNVNHEDLFGYGEEGNDTGQSWLQKIHVAMQQG